MDSPRPTSGADDSTWAAPNFANVTPTDWDALMSRRANSPFWTRVFAGWDAKWKSVPKGDAPQRERDHSAPEPAPQTSSSSSLSLPEEDPDAIPQQKCRKKRPKYSGKSLAKTVNGAIQRTRIKREAKKWFTQLTSNIHKEESGSSQAWRQRRVAGEELLRIAEQEADGDVAVVRRFTKSLTRQLIGLRAILRLCEEEERTSGHFGERHFPPSRNRFLHYSALCTSYCLMVLFMLHADRTLFLETIIGGVLREEIDYGLRGIYFLATSIPDFFDRVDPVVIFEYAIRAIRSSPRPEHRWTQALELIYHSFCHGSNSTEPKEAATLSTGRLIVKSTVELHGEGYREPVLSNIIRKVDSETRVFNLSGSLVVKVIALCTDELQIGTIMSPDGVVRLAKLCVGAMRDNGATLRDESNAIKETLFPPMSSPRDRPLGKTLDLLLWLSNMPADVAQAHRALIGGDACRFLGSILTGTASLEWKWWERDNWRAKGEAMTCLGNIIERMNETELRDHVPKAVIEAAVAMKKNQDAPLTQRGQAIFMLQRYTVAADRCGVEPYHREEVPPLENEQEGAEVQVGEAQG
ncbi:hypothetical protein FS837_011171 [Tulasnella sp. UAMH 9824]|nr:hypothetical protein FS837_011171 [Tulasnella sp. UAMH 9824]